MSMITTSSMSLRLALRPPMNSTRLPLTKTTILGLNFVVVYPNVNGLFRTAFHNYGVVACKLELGAEESSANASAVSPS